MNEAKTTRTFDATTKTFYGNLFKRWGLHVETEYEIFSQARRIDLVVTCPQTEQKKLAHTLFAYFRELNAIELKGYHDPLTIKDFNRIMMRTWGLGAVDFGKEKDGFSPSRLPNQRTLTIICITRPQKILEEYQSIFAFKPTQEPGVYHASGLLDIWLIHPTELTLCKRNYPLLALARGEKLQQFIELCLIKGFTEYLELIFYVGFATDPEIIWQKIWEAYQMKHIIHEETWPVIDEFFRQVPEAMGKLPSFQEILTEKLQQGLQEGRQEGQHEGKQTTLIRQLKLKFSDVPQQIIHIIKNTHDDKRLDYWLEQVIIVNKLDEINFEL